MPLIWGIPVQGVSPQTIVECRVGVDSCPFVASIPVYLFPVRLSVRSEIDRQFRNLASCECDQNYRRSM